MEEARCSQSVGRPRHPLSDWIATMTADDSLNEEYLSQFTGSECLYKHSLVKHIRYTDGAKFVAERGGAYWLIDEIAFAQFSGQGLLDELFQHWLLSVHEDRTAFLRCDEGNGKRLYEKAIEYTDFPLSQVRFYECEGIILLPSEY
jgi:hypothetical protein